MNTLLGSLFVRWHSSSAITGKVPPPILVSSKRKSKSVKSKDRCEKRPSERWRGGTTLRRKSFAMSARSALFWRTAAVQAQATPGCHSFVSVKEILPFVALSCIKTFFEHPFMCHTVKHLGATKSGQVISIAHLSAFIWTVGPEYFVCTLFSCVLSVHSGLHTKMKCRKAQARQKSASVSGCTKISCVRKVRGSQHTEI